MKKETVKVVSLGKAIMQNGTTAIGIQHIDDDENKIGEPRYYNKLPGYHPGMIYTVDAEIDDDVFTIFSSSREFFGQLQNKEWLLEIQVDHDMSKSRIAAKSLERKLLREQNPVIDCLEPIRELYDTTNAEGRLAIEVRVLAYLRRGR